MGHEETEKSVEEIVDMIKKGDLSLAPKLYEQTKGIICYVIWREWRREHIRRGAKARGRILNNFLQWAGIISSTEGLGEAAGVVYFPGGGHGFESSSDMGKQICLEIRADAAVI